MALTDIPSSSSISTDAQTMLTATTAKRFMLLGLFAVAATGGLVTGVDETGAQATDPNLALLLEAMLVMKAALALVGFGAVWWRLGMPASATLTAGYIGGAALLALGSALLFKGGGFMTAGTVFHAGILALLVLAWRDGFDKASGRRSLASNS